MKIAVPTRGNVVDDHFGHCEMYTVFTIGKNKTIENAEILPSSQGCGCKSNIASVLNEMGVSVMLAGNMGNGALNVLNNQGIQVIRGCSGDARQVVIAYLRGFILDSSIGCHQHENHSAEKSEGHQCGGH
jgi:predicted Fe-Mo cluster-binding NifX family protein